MTLPGQSRNSSGSELLPRAELNKRLGAAFKKPFVVVSAGAGFGKTTAVSEYLLQSGFRTVWFAFTESDNMPSRFWDHLTRVFARHRPGLGGKMHMAGFPESFQMFGGFLADLAAELYQDEKEVASQRPR